MLIGRESWGSTFRIKLHPQWAVLPEKWKSGRTAYHPYRRGKELAVGGNRLMKEKLQHQACSMGSHGGPKLALSLSGRSPESRNRQLTSRHKILDFKRAF